MLYAGDEAKSAREVVITDMPSDDITVDDFRFYIRIIYGGIDTIPIERVPLLLRLASLYHTPLVSKHVSALLSAMTSELTPESVCSLFNNAVSLGGSLLTPSSIYHITLICSLVLLRK
jgi:hypothetical protein